MRKWNFTDQTKIEKNEKEIWRQAVAPNFGELEGVEVSSLGNARGDCYINTAFNGYKLLVIKVNRKQKKFGLHTVVLNSFFPKPFDDAEVNHINMITSDCRLSNLEWVSSSENKNKAFVIRRHNKGTTKPTPTRVTSRDGMDVKEFPTLTLAAMYAAKQFGSSAKFSTITGLASYALNGKIKTAYGYRFERV